MWSCLTAQTPLTSLAQPGLAETCSERRVFPPAAAMFVPDSREKHLPTPPGDDIRLGGCRRQQARGPVRPLSWLGAGAWGTSPGPQALPDTRTIRTVAPEREAKGRRVGQGQAQGWRCQLWHQVCQQQACSPGQGPAALPSHLPSCTSLSREIISKVVSVSVPCCVFLPALPFTLRAAGHLLAPLLAIIFKVTHLTEHHLLQDRQ